MHQHGTFLRENGSASTLSGSRRARTTTLSAARTGAEAQRVSVVVPTFNEAGNVAELVRRLERVADRSRIAEVIFVDDSTDHTPGVIADVAGDSSIEVRLVHRRRGERLGGLSGAVLTGISVARSPWVLVMDGDLQHPPEDVPRLMSAVGDGSQHDLVIASRYCEGGATDGLSGLLRRVVSLSSVSTSRVLFPRRLASCSDTMTGFFVVRRAAVDLSVMRPRGFKVLLEILGRHDLRVSEIPFTFAERASGDSKASMTQGWTFVRQLARLRVDAWRGTHLSRGAAFATIGLVGLVLDVGLFNILLAGTGRPLTSKLISSMVAVAASYVMNRHWTWRDRPRGRAHRELVTFAMLSLVGVGIAEACLLGSHYLLGLTTTLDDNLSANVVGLAIGMVWRYWSYDKWAFPAPSTASSTASSSAPTTQGPVAVRRPELAAVPAHAWVGAE